jgi:hypothetical protein
VTRSPREKRRLRGRKTGEHGQVLLLYLIFLIPMAMVLFSVWNVGMAVGEKTKVQNAADNAAYSAAVWEARYMNLTAYTNRAMVANYDTVATFVALWSSLDAWDGFIQLARRILDAFFGLGEVLAPIHEAFHQANEIVGTQVVGGSDQQQRLGFYLESYNRILSHSEEALYFLNQGGRQSIVSEIAHGVDSRIQASTYAEFFNGLSLDVRRRWSPTDANSGWPLPGNDADQSQG